MSLLGEVIFHEEDSRVKCLAHLLKLLQILGWETILDTRVIKPNLRGAQLYIRRNKKKLADVFARSFDNIDKYDVIDVINPFMIRMWSIQIVGDPAKASIELLHSTLRTNNI